jgi:hypothetical protein
MFDNAPAGFPGDRQKRIVEVAEAHRLEMAILCLVEALRRTL